jgi:ADP-ribose pyrophosphatase YjhB (NUDIX family)
VEIEESLEDGLRREVREETGLAAVECSLFRVFDDPTRIVRYPDGNVVRLLTFAYEVRVEDFGTLRRSEESKELRFFRREELASLDVIETARPIIDGYVSRDDPPS